MAASDTRNVLVVNVDPELFAKLEPLLARHQLELDRFPRAAMALELLAAIPFDLLLAVYPLPDIEMQTFLDALRAPGSACRQTPLLLLAAGAQLEAAERFVGRGVTRLVPLEDSADRLRQELSRFLAMEPRSAPRAAARFHVRVEAEGGRMLCQSANVSTTGMLLTGDVVPVGSRVGFEFTLGRDLTAVRGEGEVVRHTTPGREQTRGMGVRFLGFERDGLQRLQRFLDGLASPPS
ncbi:MAG TPA: PilZ domain-containing protein [Thermoanaerobaculia bacterium]|nr:PilZ domain-containing protein [Thermoanaerobaculia bacterium]